MSRVRVGEGRDRGGSRPPRVLHQVRQPVGPGGQPPALRPSVPSVWGARERLEDPVGGNLTVEWQRYQIVVLGRYPSLIARDDPQVAIELRVRRESRLVSCGTLTLRESEWEPLRRVLEAGSGGDVDVVEWGDRMDRIYRPA